VSNIKRMFSNQARKAFVAAAIAGVSTAVALAPDGITLAEGLTIAGAALAAFQGTYWTSNAPEAPQVAPVPAWTDERLDR
jgi:hypothetical protein